MSKYGVFSGPYFPAFSPNTGKYGAEKSPNLDTFHACNFAGLMLWIRVPILEAYLELSWISMMELFLQK